MMQKPDRSARDDVDYNSLPLRVRISLGIFTWHSGGSKASTTTDCTHGQTPAEDQGARRPQPAVSLENAEDSGRQESVDYNSLPVYTRIQHGIYTWHSRGQQANHTSNAVRAQNPPEKSTNAPADGRRPRAIPNYGPAKKMDYNSLSLHERIRYIRWKLAGQE